MKRTPQRVVIDFGVRVAYNEVEKTERHTLVTQPALQKNLFEQAEMLAQQMNISRSRLFVLALEDYIRRQQDRELLAQINAAYADEPDACERTVRQQTKSTHRRIVEGEW